MTLLESLLKALPLPLLIYFLYGSQITEWIMRLSLSLFASQLPVFLALLASLIVAIRVVQIRVTLRSLASLQDRSYTFSSLAIVISFGLFTIGSYLPEFQVSLHWISILAFLVSYVSILYGKALAKAIIPLTLAFMPLALPLVSYGFVFSFLGVKIIKDRITMKSEVCGFSHEELASGDFCRFCGEISKSSQKVEIHTKTVLRLALIGLLVLVFNAAYIPAFVVDDGRFVFAKYTPEGLLTENIIRISDPHYLIAEADLFSDKRPLASLTSESSEVIALERSSATLETYHLDDDSGRIVNLMTVTRFLPYIDDQGNLASDQLNVFVLGGSEPGDVTDLKNQMILLGNQINQRLLIPIQLTPWLHTFSTMFSQSIPLLLSITVAASLLITAMWIRRIEVERDHKITLASSFPKNLGLVALIALSKGSRELLGRDLYEKARDMGYEGNIKEIVDDLVELERRDFLSSKLVLHGGHLLRLWTAGI